MNRSHDPDTYESEFESRTGLFAGSPIPAVNLRVGPVAGELVVSAAIEARDELITAKMIHDKGLKAIVHESRGGADLHMVSFSASHPEARSRAVWNWLIGHCRIPVPVGIVGGLDRG